MRKASIIIVLFLFFCSNVSAEKLKVGISSFPPFVIFSKQHYPSGYSIDLWESIAKQLGVEYEYIESKGVVDKLENCKRGITDLAIGGITITYEREKEFDFCYPDFQGGLSLLVLSAKEKMSFLQVLRSFFNRSRLKIIGVFLLVLIIAGHLIWLSEKGGEINGNAFSEKYWPGVFEGMYWTVITASTIGYGDKVPQRFLGRVVAMLLVLIFLPLFTCFIVQLSSDINLNSQINDIWTYKDLRSKHKVGAIQHTTSEQFLLQHNVQPYLFPCVNDACNALYRRELDAFIYDSSLLMYFAKHEGKGKVCVVDKFAIQNYGIVVVQDSPLRERINLALLSLKPEELESLNNKWFGN
jgi:polar amino acid transport system substrate-binding protein